MLNTAMPVDSNSVREVKATLVSGGYTTKVSREELALIQSPEATSSFKPIAHIDLIKSLEQTLSYRKLEIVREEFAVSDDGMKLFGFIVINDSFFDGSLAIGFRHANDKSMSLALVGGYQVFICENMTLKGDYYPLKHKHTARFDLSDSLALGVERLQRRFEDTKQNVEMLKGMPLNDYQAKAIICDAFVQGDLKIPLKMIKSVYDNYFEPAYDDFKPRSAWSLLNAFTSSFKELPPTTQFQATGKLGAYMDKLQLV